MTKVNDELRLTSCLGWREQASLDQCTALLNSERMVHSENIDRSTANCSSAHE
jgi:hypothetical protein